MTPKKEILFVLVLLCRTNCKLFVQLAGTQYEDVDLSGGDYAEYDEKGECPVMISNLRFKFEVVKH